MRRSSSIAARPLARLVRLRVRGRSAFLVVRLSEAGDRARASPARASWSRGARAPQASTASASACPPACPRACASSSSTPPATPARAGPFRQALLVESELIVSSGTISRIGARRASSARLASSSSPGDSLGAVDDQPPHRQVAAPRGLERERGVVDRAPPRPADDHERQAERLARSAVVRFQPIGASRPDGPSTSTPSLRPAQREVDLAHVLRVDGGDRLAAASTRSRCSRGKRAPSRPRRRERARSASASRRRRRPGPRSASRA